MKYGFLFQLDYPAMVEGLVLININPCAEGWMDWAAQKVSANHKSLKRYINYEF